MIRDDVNRRDFIRTFGVLTGTAMMASVPWLNVLHARSKNQTITGTVKLAILGVGSRGSLLTLLLQDAPGVEIVAYCDDYPPNFKRAGEMIGPGAKGFTDYREMLAMADFEGVVIATPLYEHAEMTVNSLRAGKHVFCEKAMAKTLEDCKRMVDAQRETGQILQIGHQRMFDVKYLKAIEEIRKGKLGNITQIRAYWHRNNDWRRPIPGPELERKINWRLYREYSLGLMTELASHQIQVANWILEEVPQYVSGFGSINHWHDGREVYDNVNLVYQYPSGSHLIYDSMTSNKKYGYEEQIMGPLGTMELEAGKVFEEFPPPAPGILQLINQIETRIFDTIPIGGASWVPDDPNEDKGKYIMDKVLNSDGTDMELSAFAESVRSGTHTDELLKQAYYASIATLLGDQAMLKKEVLEWPQEYMI